MLEQEYRYEVSEENIKKIKEICSELETTERQIDLTLGYLGFNSLEKYGYVCRVRQKGNKTWMEIKTRVDDYTFNEVEIPINDFNKGVEFFKAIGMTPYLYMNRSREILEYKNLKIFIDDIELLGKFIEIEFHDVQNASKNIESFLSITKICSEKRPLYGDIFKHKIETNQKFRIEFEEFLDKFLKEN